MYSNRGLVDNGASVICIHGRTRGSTKNRRCGPADLAAIATIARTLAVEYGERVLVLSNGNITSTQDVVHAVGVTAPCIGVMSAEGILANPALFEALHSSDSCKTTTPPGRNELPALADQNPQTSKLALFREYCALSAQYAALGGWAALDAYHRRAHAHSGVPDPAVGLQATAESTVAQEATPNPNMSVKDNSKIDGAATVCAPKTTTATSATNAYTPEPRQIYIARQHLTWMLGKSGHGRTVRYEHIGPQYRKHVHLKAALDNARIG